MSDFVISRGFNFQETSFSENKTVAKISKFTVVFKIFEHLLYFYHSDRCYGNTVNGVTVTDLGSKKVQTNRADLLMNK